MLSIARSNTIGAIPRIAHTIADIIRARVFAICCGQRRGDLNVLRSDPALKLACGRLPDSGRDLCSQPTLSRLENALGRVCHRERGKRVKMGVLP